jgi:hypothetical protein
MVDALSHLSPVLLKDKLVEHGEAELAKLCAGPLLSVGREGGVPSAVASETGVLATRNTRRKPMCPWPVACQEG